MSKIRGKNTRPEVLFRMRLVRQRVAGFRMHYGPHKIDFAWPEKRIAIFIDGCFWHGCPEHGRRPKTHKAYWNQHIDENMRRDESVGNELSGEGWRVIRIWEHTVKRDLNGRVAVQRHRGAGARPGVGRDEDHLAGGD